MSQEVFINGIDASTGGPLDEFPITVEMLAKVARGQRLTPEDLKDAKIRRALDAQKGEHFGVTEGIDMADLAQTGWGVIFPASLPQKSVEAIKEALKPLLDLRKAQATRQNADFYREFIGPENGYKDGESKNDFLKRFGRGPGPADPSLGVPYYLLIVGSPETIPFTFQYQLDVQYAVGRIYFDRLEDYYQYAQSVASAETGKLARSRTMAFFGTANPHDAATRMSSQKLIQPLAGGMQERYKDWNIKLVAPEQATKTTLSNFMGGADTPALLFTASHGMSFRRDDARLLRQTGALLCQDWPGPQAYKPIDEALYFSADDLSADADVFGMIAFLFACYGGGIPRSDNFYRQAFGKPKEIAPYAFISPLPLKLLSHPKGGALGVFAHVERAWGASIVWDGAVADVETFNSTLSALLNGKPAGAATEYFNERYAEVSTTLTEELDNTSPDNEDVVKLAGMWTSNNDARNYTFVGDPAVRLAAGGKPTDESERSRLGALVSHHPASLSGAASGFQPDVVERAPTAGVVTSVSNADYGVAELFKKDDAGGANLSQSLKSFVDKLGDTLSRTLDDATSLEISTYVATDLAKVKYKDGKFTHCELRAMTRVSLDGDTLVCVPEKDGQVDNSVWEMHIAAVEQAQKNRADLMSTIVDAATNLAGLLK